MHQNHFKSGFRCCFPSHQILQKINPTDPSADRTGAIIDEILTQCGDSPQLTLSPTTKPSYLSQYKAPLLSTAALLVLSYIYWSAGYVST